MNDYKELIRSLGNGHVIGFNDDGFPVMRFPSELEKIAAGVIEQLVKERDALRNELCLRCGEYTEAHNGACNGCRWRITDD